MTASTKKTKNEGALTREDVHQRMLDKLGQSALDEEDARLMKLEPLTGMGMRSLKLPEFPAFKIPYFTLQGKVDKFFRARYVVSTLKGFDAVAGKKPLRYVQPAKSESGVYLPPFVDWVEMAADATQPLVITEGELKAACATKYGFPTLGLGGVYSFQSNAHNHMLIPALAEFEWSERIVYICYDSDSSTNPNVLVAEQRLAQRLTELGALVHITRLPAQEELAKCGLDDFIVLRGAEAFAELLDSEKTYAYDAAKVLHGLSERVVYVRDPGIIWDHTLKRRMSPSDFTSHQFANVHYWAEVSMPKGGTTRVKKPAATAWLQWEARAECLGLAFRPGAARITEDGYLNTWTGWGVTEPIAGDVSPWHELMEHIFAGAPEARRWFERWAAYPIQNPGAKLATAMAVWGPTHGSGKTLIGHTLMRVYGTKHSVELKDADLEDDRNEWADSKCFALCDDITAKGDRKLMRKLMTMVTQKMLRINTKYVPSYFLEDLINYYYTSNEPDMFYMDENDRRFYVHETQAGKFLNYKRYVAWRDSDEGIAALWHYLLSIDLGDFDPQAPAPVSDGKKAMIDMGKSELGAWVLEFRRNTDYMLKQANMTGDLFTMKQLHALYDPMGNKKASPNALSREFKREGYNPCCAGAPVRLSNGQQLVVWPVRNFDKWKKAPWGEVKAEYEKHTTVSASKKF